MANEFDPAALDNTCELKIAYCLRAMTASLLPFQQLCKVDSAEEALAKIDVGMGPAPANGQKFTEDELAQRFVFLEINRAPGSHIVLARGLPGQEPYQSGKLEFELRRYVRKEENQNRANFFNRFWDRVSALTVELQQAVGDGYCGATKNIVCTQGPFRSPPELKVSQGDFFWAILVATWGDNDALEQ